MMHGFGYGAGTYGGFGLIGLILNLVIVVGLVVALVLLVAWLWRQVGTGGHMQPTRQQSQLPETLAKQILQRRYAQGEITREQYQQMLADLS
jgi:putative membrane protein